MAQRLVAEEAARHVDVGIRKAEEAIAYVWQPRSLLQPVLLYFLHPVCLACLPGLCVITLTHTVQESKGVAQLWQRLEGCRGVCQSRQGDVRGRH